MIRHLIVYNTKRELNSRPRLFKSHKRARNKQKFIQQKGGNHLLFSSLEHKRDLYSLTFFRVRENGVYLVDHLSTTVLEIPLFCSISSSALTWVNQNPTLPFICPLILRLSMHANLFIIHSFVLQLKRKLNFNMNLSSEANM